MRSEVETYKFSVTSQFVKLAPVAQEICCKYKEIMSA